MLYEYEAKKLNGEELNGKMEAVDKNDLARKLHEQGYILLSARETGIKRGLLATLPIPGLVSAADKIMFAKNLGVMISAGLPLTRSLEILGRQTNNKVFKKIILSLMEDAKKGNPLSEAMKKYPRVFSRMFVAMVKTGEESGQLSDSLKMAGQQLERDHALMRKVKGAMMYPSIILIAMFLIGIFMFIYVVPTLVSTFKELNMELPLSTRVIIFISDALTQHTYLFAAAFFVAVFGLLLFFRTETGKRILGNILLNVPILSPVAKKINSARTSRTLASLVSSGVNVVEALNITKDVLQNLSYKEILNKAIEDVQKGIPISNAFKNATKFYPVMVGEMIAVGEETGKITEMLERVASFYEDEVAEATKNMTTIIEPVLMLFIGGAVGFFALSMIRPMYSVMNGI